MKIPYNTALTLAAALVLGACSDSGGDGGGGGLGGLVDTVGDDAQQSGQPQVPPPTRPDTGDTATSQPLPDDDPNAPTLDTDGEGFPGEVADDTDFPNDDDVLVDLPTDGSALDDPALDADGNGIPDFLDEIFADLDLDEESDDPFDDDPQPIDTDSDGIPDEFDDTIGGGSGDASAIVGLWDGTLEVGGLTDVTYIEFTPDGELFIYDYLGDSFAEADGEGANCYEIFGGPFSSLGGDGYRLSFTDGTALDFVASLTTGGLFFSVTDPDTDELLAQLTAPPLQGLSSVDFNACV